MSEVVTVWCEPATARRWVGSRWLTGRASRRCSNDGLTTIEGQGFLPLDEDHATVETSEAASIAEANGDLDEAAVTHVGSTNAMRSRYNYANIRMTGAYDDVAAHKRPRPRRQPVEARYPSLCQGRGPLDAASPELTGWWPATPLFDALFNSPVSA